MDYGPAPRVRRPALAGSTATTAASATSSAANGPRPARAFASDQPRDRRAARRSRPRRRRRRRPRRQAAARKAHARLAGAARPRARQLSLRPRPPGPEARAACSPCSRPSTTASPSARPATSTSRSSPATSTTTPAGRSRLDREFPGLPPDGVCGQIIPWNFPLLMLAWKIAPALAAGNTVVLKPAEYTPLTALLFAEICRDSRPPARRRQHRHRRRRAPARRSSTTPTSTRSPSPARPRSAAIIRKATAGSGKSLTLELGGKSPFIVFDDADLDSAVEGLVDAIWFNQGQVCCAGSRLLVQEGDRHERSAPSSPRGMATLRVGDPLDKAIDMGADRRRRCSSSASATWSPKARRGRRDAARSPAELPGAGCFFPPTLITDVGPAATVAQEEIFGPVLVVHELPHPGRGGGPRQQHRATASPPASGARTSTSPSTSRRKIKRRRRLGQRHQHVRRRRRLRRLCARAATAAKAAARACSTTSAAKPAKVDEALASRRDGRARRREAALDGLDRTAKLYIGGKQARPDCGYSLRRA